MSESEIECEEPRRKKGKINKHLHSREIMKLARRRGEEFVTDEGLLVEAKQTGPDCNCRKHCMKIFLPAQRKAILQNLYNGSPKNEQDIFLIGLIDRVDVARHRSLNQKSKQNSSTFKFFVMKETECVPVCRKAYISLHSLSNKVVSRLTNLKEANKTPQDMRGKHKNRGNAIRPSVIASIHEHINSFPTHIAHYTSTPVTYLDAELSVTTMFKLFVEKYPNLKDTVKYEYYLKYFKDNFSYRFGRPQVDVCSTCEDLNTKIKSQTLNDTAKRAAVAEILVHKRRAKKFYNKLQEVTALSKERADVSGIVFDYMQNLPLPFMKVQEMFYLRKLWYFVFNVHDLKNDKSIFYCYPEGVANKGPDEVCSFVLHYINSFIPQSVKHLHVFSDACAGQNRNHTLSRLLLYLSMTGRFVTINQYYPVRGHSFMPCDRTFGVVKRAVRKYDRIYSPDQYKVIICNSKKKIPGYEVVDVQNQDIFDFKTWWPKYFKKTTGSVGNQQVKFTISKYRHLIYDTNLNGYIKASEFIDGAFSTIFKLKKTDAIQLPTESAYNGKVPIKEKKIEDVSSVLKYIPDEYMPFYEERMTWPTAGEAITDGMEDD